jgi:NAD/NADP transhydrogenase alpha subunit
MVVPGRKMSVMVTRNMVTQMEAGSVTVDMVTETQGSNPF